jgi:hypothetical protein
MPQLRTNTVNVSIQRASFAAMLGALLTGLQSDFPGVDPFVVDGETVARADLVARIQAALDTIAAVKVARAGLQSAVAKQKLAIADARGLRAGVKRIAQSKFGPTSPLLQNLGFAPNRLPNASVQTKADAKAKAEATRVANGNVGKKTRKVTPATAPAAAVAPPAPLAPPTTPKA